MARKRVTIDLDTSLTDDDLWAAVMVAVFDYFDTEARLVSVEVVGDEKDDGS